MLRVFFSWVIKCRLPSLRSVGCHNHCCPYRCVGREEDRLSDDTGEGGAEEHCDQTETSLGDGLVGDGSAGGGRSPSRRAGGGTGRSASRGAGGRASGRCSIIVTSAEDVVEITALVGQTVAQLFPVLALG